MKLLLVVLVLTVAVSCGTDPLSACFEEVDGSLDCSHQVFLSVDLSDRNLRNIDLSAADLTEATLTEAVLVGANLRGAFADEDTFWPVGFDPVAAGVIFE